MAAGQGVGVVPGRSFRDRRRHGDDAPRDETAGGAFSAALCGPPCLSISSLWENATWLGRGARLDDKLAAHAWAAAKDADSSAKLRRTAEALKTLAESSSRTSARQARPVGSRSAMWCSAVLDEADRLLDNMKLKLDGNDVQLQASVEMDQGEAGSLDDRDRRAATKPPGRQHQEGDDGAGRGLFPPQLSRHNFAQRRSSGAKSRRPRKAISPSVTSTAPRFGTESPRSSTRYSLSIPRASSYRSTMRRNVRLRLRRGCTRFGKKVSDFPESRGLDDPRGRLCFDQPGLRAEGDAAWPRLSVPSLAAWLRAGEQKLRLSVPAPAGPAQDGEKKPLPKPAADRLLGAEILEVHAWDGIHAVVIAREEVFGPQGSDMDMRWLTRGHRALAERRQR